MAITDEAVWLAERRLWLEGAVTYEALVEPDAVVALPGVGLMTGAEASQAMANNDGWASVDMTQRRLLRSGRNAIAIGYCGHGKRHDESSYKAWCTSTYHAAGDGWRLIQHQQTPTS